MIPNRSMTGAVLVLVLLALTPSVAAAAHADAGSAAAPCDPRDAVGPGAAPVPCAAVSGSPASAYARHGVGTRDATGAGDAGEGTCTTPIVIHAGVLSRAYHVYACYTLEPEDTSASVHVEQYPWWCPHCG